MRLRRRFRVDVPPERERIVTLLDSHIRDAAEATAHADKLKEEFDPSFQDDKGSSSREESDNESDGSGSGDGSEDAQQNWASRFALRRRVDLISVYRE